VKQSADHQNITRRNSPVESVLDKFATTQHKAGNKLSSAESY